MNFFFKDKKAVLLSSLLFYCSHLLLACLLFSKVFGKEERNKFFDDSRSACDDPLRGEVERPTIRCNNNAASLLNKEHASRDVPYVDPPLVERAEAPTRNRGQRDGCRPRHPHRKDLVCKEVCNVSVYTRTHICIYN